MKFSVQSSDLKKALKKIVPLINEKALTAALKTIKVVVNNGMMTLDVINVNVMTARAVLPCTVHEPGETCVIGSVFLDYIDTLADIPLHMEMINGSRLRTKAGRSTVHFSTVNPDECPMTHFNYDAMTYPLVKDLFKTLGMVSYCACNDETRVSLQSVFLNNGDVISVDGHRMALVSNYIKTDIPVLLPIQAIRKVERLFKSVEDLGVSFGPSDICIYHDNFWCSIRLMDASKYPNYSVILPREPYDGLMVDKKLLIDALKRVSIFTHEKSKAVRLDIGESEMKIIATNEDGDVEDAVPCTYTGPQKLMGFNCTYLKEAIEKMPDGNVEFHVRAAMKPLILNGQGIIHVVMPLLVNK